MWRLQHTKRRGPDSIRQATFHLTADVTRQHNGYVAVAKLQHNRVVVPHLATFPVWLGRTPDLERDAGVLPALARAEHLPGKPGAARPLAQRVHRRVRWHHDAIPDEGRREDIEHTRGAADVIRIAVRQQQGVEPADAARPHGRCDDPRADIVAGVDREAASIDQHRAPIRKLDERGVALPDVDRDDVQAAIAAPRRAPGLRMPDHPARHRRRETNAGATADDAPVPRTRCQARSSERQREPREVGDGDPPRRCRDAPRDDRHPVDESCRSNEQRRAGHRHGAGYRGQR